MSNGKDMIIHLIAGLIKKDVKVDLSNYARTSDLKKHITC